MEEFSSLLRPIADPIDHPVGSFRLWYPRTTPAFLKRMRQIVTDVVERIPRMSGPARKRIGDAMAVQTRALAEALELSIEIPARDLVVLNRP